MSDIVHSKVLNEVLGANSRYVSEFGDKGELPMPPARKFAILTCMDARLDPAKFAGLEEGDAHVIRNAGGRASDDAIRSLVISYKLLGTREWFVIHHTNCGLESLTEEFRHELEMEVGQRPAWAVECFRDVDQDVRQSMQRVRTSPFLLHNDDVRGFVFDVKTGLLREVDAV